MNLLMYLIWSLIGSGLAFLFLISQRWSVEKINPDRHRFSTSLVVGGAILRWLVISIFFLLALSYHITALLTVFGTFMIFRLIILFMVSNKTTRYHPGMD